jgi:hypothetical protein
MIWVDYLNMFMAVSIFKTLEDWSFSKMESQPHKLTDHQEVGEEIDLHWFAHG